MKKLIKTLLVLLFFTIGTYMTFGLSLGMITQESPFNATLFITILTPAAVWLANIVITKVAPLIPSWAILGLVPLLGAGMDYINQVLTGGSAGMVVTILASLGAVFINEVLKNWGARNSMSKNRTAFKAKKGI